MKILVTGADGFTGRYFVDSAKNREHQVIELRSNILDYDALSEEILSIEPQAVVHLAAISYVGHGNWADFYTVNVVGTINLLNVLCQLKKSPEAVLIASSANVYGNSQESPISETVIYSPLNDYAVSKVAMEYAVKLFEDKLPVLVTRPFNYTGRGQSPSFLIPKLVAHFATRKTIIELGNLDVARDFLDVRALVDVYIQLVEKKISSETVNVCSGKTYQLSEILKMLETISSHQIEVVVNPAFVRSNELKTLCGNNTKLKELGIRIPNIDLNNTLQWMLAE